METLLEKIPHPWGNTITLKCKVPTDVSLSPPNPLEADHKCIRLDLLDRNS